MSSPPSSPKPGVLPSPGARVVIRDAEWIVRRVDNDSDGGWQLTCDGISEVVRGRTALFLTGLEDRVQVLDPAATEFVADGSPRYAASLLHIESTLRSQVPNDSQIYIGHRGAMDLVPYQLDPALQALRQHRQRILIADAVGLGKTLEAGILVAELIQRGRGNRILVVTLKSDLRILEILQQKDEQAYRNIGDPSVFMRVYDADAEERLTESAMAEGMSADTFDATYQPKPDEGEDFLSLFMTAPEESLAPVPNSQDAIARLPGLFPRDFAFCKAALEILGRETPLQWQADDPARRIILTAPPDLQVRLRQLPRELWPEHGQFVLTDDAGQIQQEVARCRQDETAWPKLHYLWPQHLVMDWLIDRLRAAFGRHQAPVLRSSRLAAGDAAFLIAGTLPNHLIFTHISQAILCSTV